MFYIIYETTNIINGKKYIGKHVSNTLEDNYLGSGIAVKNAIKNMERNVSYEKTYTYFQLNMR